MFVRASIRSASTLREWCKTIKPIAHVSEDVSKQTALHYRASLLQPRGPLKGVHSTYRDTKGLWNRAIDFDMLTGDNPWHKADRKLKYVHRGRSTSLSSTKSLMMTLSLYSYGLQVPHRGGGRVRPSKHRYECRAIFQFCSSGKPHAEE